MTHRLLLRSMFAKKEEIELAVTGMTCGHCVEHVTHALQGVRGVKQADVSLEEGRARVTAKEGTSREALVAAVAEAGYEASLD